MSREEPCHVSPSKFLRQHPAEVKLELEMLGFKDGRKPGVHSVQNEIRQQTSLLDHVYMARGHIQADAKSKP